MWLLLTNMDADGENILVGPQRWGMLLRNVKELCENWKSGENGHSICEQNNVLLVQFVCIMYINILVRVSFCVPIHGAVISYN
jgi:hypothetical protein